VVRHGSFPPGCIGSQVVLSGVLAERARRLGQPPRKRRYSWTTRVSVGLLFRNCPQATGLTLSDPAHRRFSLQKGRRLVLAVAPGTALAGGMLLPTAALADHGLILAHLPRATRAARLKVRSPLALLTTGAAQVRQRLCSRAASACAARPIARPRSSRPTCRTFQAC